MIHLAAFLIIIYVGWLLCEKMNITHLFLNIFILIVGLITLIGILYFMKEFYLSITKNPFLIITAIIILLIPILFISKKKY